MLLAILFFATCAGLIPLYGAGNSSSPSQILNLENWKITLPIGSEKGSNRPLEIRHPALSGYQIPPWFAVASDGGVAFRAAVVGVTTKGAKYPRSELREMADGGLSQASWDSTHGTHEMFIDQAITKTPSKKQEVVAGQIHDANDDILFIRLEGAKLFVSVDGKNACTLDKSYVLGTRFAIKLEVRDGKTSVYYNGSTSPAHVLVKNYAGAYFKAGVYVQSNCKTEGPSLCSLENYGEVTIYNLQVKHKR